MSSLFEITTEFQRLYELATDEEIDEEAFAGTLESLIGELEVKSAGYVHVIKTLEMEEQKAAEVEEAFKRKKEIRQKRIKKLKDAVRDAMLLTDQKEIQAGDFTIKLKGNGGQQPLVIDKPEDIPDTCKIIKYENDNKKIREYLENHKDCSWAHLEERGKHIEIK